MFILPAFWLASRSPVAATRLAPSPAPPSSVKAPHRLQSPALWASAAILVALGWSYAGPLAAMAVRWMNEPDYSHGFLVPVFAAYLLWSRRQMLELPLAGGSWWGVAFLL